MNGDGEPRPISSGDVNDYIREATGGEFTAKHFRTWGASVIAFEQMLVEKKRMMCAISVKTVVEPVAEALGNTSAMSRKSYVHPALLEAVKRSAARPARRHRAAARAQAAVVARKSACSSFSPAAQARTARARRRRSPIRAPPTASMRAAMTSPMASRTGRAALSVSTGSIETATA